MPAMKELQCCSHLLNIAGAARSYGIVVFLNLMAVTQRVGTRKISELC